MSLKGIHVDINCDLGEGIGRDEDIMPYISSANIACGYHAGNEHTIWETIELAQKYNVAIGAHPSFLDKENFGRNEMQVSADDIYELITQQLILFDEIVFELSAGIRHVKPHGALYNLSANNRATAKAIAQAIKDYDINITLFGLSGSHSISEAKAIGLKTASEVFADRSYRDDGSLTPRSHPNAMIEEPDTVIKHVLQMIQERTVTTIEGKKIPVVADTICIHGDGRHAVDWAKNIYEHLKQNNIDIEAI